MSDCGDLAMDIMREMFQREEWLDQVYRRRTVFDRVRAAIQSIDNCDTTMDVPTLLAEAVLGIFEGEADDLMRDYMTDIGWR